MIFAFTGTQLPFPRMLDALDRIAARNGLDVIAQTSEPLYTSEHMACQASFGAAEFDALVKRADLLVAHAGIGSIIAAALHAKPIILHPRRAGLGEHRNDHQLATVAKLSFLPGVYIAHEEDELERLILLGGLAPAAFVESPERAKLIGFLGDYIASA